MIGDCERRASSLLVEVDNHYICSQKIQMYTVTVSGWRRRALWTGTALAVATILDVLFAITSLFGWVWPTYYRPLVHLGFKGVSRNPEAVCGSHSGPSGDLRTRSIYVITHTYYIYA